jgi:S-formylglutathione hydrolase
VKHFVSVPVAADQALATAGAREAIIVMPNAFTKFFGSMYSSSATIGDWESFVAVDLVSDIDKRYRTLPTAGSRGIAGHSMGGYGALRIAMKRPETFSAVFALSPCCLEPTVTVQGLAGKAEGIRTFEDIAAADFFTKAAVAGAAAWSPNPKRPPLFLDPLVQNGEVHPQTAAKWHANGILATADQHVPQLRQLRAIALDAGDKDSPSIPPTARAFSELLTSYGVTHTFEIYPGTHVSGVADRLRNNVLPFFWKHLNF